MIFFLLGILVGLLNALVLIILGERYKVPLAQITTRLEQRSSPGAIIEWDRATEEMKERDKKGLDTDYDT